MESKIYLTNALDTAVSAEAGPQLLTSLSALDVKHCNFILVS